MVMSAGLVKSETAAACENFQQKKKMIKYPCINLLSPPSPLFFTTQDFQFKGFLQPRGEQAQVHAPRQNLGLSFYSRFEHR